MRSAGIAKAILNRVVVYGGILLCSWWWMLWTPGRTDVDLLQPLNADELRVEGRLRDDVDSLANRIGERNLDFKPEKLDEAAQFIDYSLRSAGYEPKSQWYKVRDLNCRNIEVEIRGADRPREVVIVGAHYDSVPESPGADDNASAWR